MAQRYVAAEEAYQRLAQIMSTEVSIPVSESDNVKYDEGDLHRSLVALSMATRTPSQAWTAWL